MIFMTILTSMKAIKNNMM